MQTAHFGRYYNKIGSPSVQISLERIRNEWGLNSVLENPASAARLAKFTPGHRTGCCTRPTQQHTNIFPSARPHTASAAWNPSAPCCFNPSSKPQ